MTLLVFPLGTASLAVLKVCSKSWLLSFSGLESGRSDSPRTCSP